MTSSSLWLKPCLCRASAFATRKLQGSRGLSGSCLHARSAAACPPCDSHLKGDPEAGCPSGSVCMAPVVSPGDHMFKVCINPSGAAKGPRWLPGQASATGRKLMSQQDKEAGTAGKQLVGLPYQDLAHDADGAVSSQQADQSTVTEGSRTVGTKSQQAQHMPEIRTQIPNAAHLAAHPNKDTFKSISRTKVSQDVLAGSRNISQLTPAADTEAIGDRIGRVALANEHRKVIRQELDSHQEPSCPHYLVYVGTSGQLMQALEVSDFVPKSSLVPLQWPHMIEQMLVYTFAVSAALALINMAPIWYLDGEAALLAAIKLRGHSDMFYSSVTQPNRHWGRLLRCVLGIGSSVFVCVLLLHMVRLFGYDAKLGHLLHTLGKLLSFVLT